MQAIPIGQTSRSIAPGSSGGVTPTSTRLLTINDPRYDNRNFQGVHIEGEQQIQLPLGPRETEEEIRQRKEEGRNLYQSRIQKERKNPPRSKSSSKRPRY